MEFIADFHIHSHYSIATSKECNPENLYKWARIKGMSLIGTGDFTHPGWMEEMKEKLEPTDEGLLRLKPDLEQAVMTETADLGDEMVRFIVSGEISTIYKKDGRTRKVHHLILLPSLEAAEAISKRLDAIGNIKSDGRPILGLDSYRLLELVLEECPEVIYIPAHIWTPHFSLFGAASGFEEMEECYEELSEHIFAVETGLSSDPPMNWRLSALDELAIVSNSDAHSPKNLAREANLFNTDLTYDAIRDALRARDPKRFLGTLEFHPEEGKYHYDGHRKCGVCWKPAQTKAAGGLCPVCGKKLTVGVLHRVELLADRHEGCRPAAARHFESLIPLAEIIASALGVGKSTKTVAKHYFEILKVARSELAALRATPLEDLAPAAGALVIEGIRRQRAGEVEISPGFDGEYGHVGVFREGEREAFAAGGDRNLFGEPLTADKPKTVEMEPVAVAAESAATYETQPEQAAQAVLNPAQQEAVEVERGPVIVVAGPGTGKTHTLTCRVAHLVEERGVPAENVLAVTFTNKAADEMRSRLRTMLAAEGDAPLPTIGTFHSICLDILQRRSPDRLVVLDALDSRAVMREALQPLNSRLTPARALDRVSVLKSRGPGPESDDASQDASCDVPDELRDVYAAYQSRLEAYGAMDYDDILLQTLRLFETDSAALDEHRRQFPHVLVDEFQDVNAVQYRLVELWADDGASLLIIGDPDQAIYGFRGADHRYFDQLQKDFPQSRRIVLEMSYRSRPPILDAASAVIGAGEAAGLKTTREGGRAPRFLEVASETSEGIAIVREIGRMVGGATMLEAHGDRHDGTLGFDPSEALGFSDVGVLFRTGRQADKLEECFIKEGIPYRVVGQRSFLEAKSVREALAFFRCAAAPGDRFRFLQCSRLSRFSIGPRALEVVRDAVHDGTGDAEERVRAQAAEGGFPKAATEKLQAMFSTLDDYRGRLEGEPPSTLLERWMEEGDLRDDENLLRLLRLAGVFDNTAVFLIRVALCQDTEVERDNADTPEAVSLMTLHAAKGLEFPVVFIAGVEEGLIPIQGGDEDEERRLFYVGMTRAKDDLILLATRSRTRRGKTERPTPSRFLKALPSELLERTEVKLKRKPVDKQMRLF